MPNKSKASKIPIVDLLFMIRDMILNQMSSSKLAYTVANDIDDITDKAFENIYNHAWASLSNRLNPILRNFEAIVKNGDKFASCVKDGLLEECKEIYRGHYDKEYLFTDKELNPEVYIIEAGTNADIANNTFDGLILKHQLEHFNKHPKYEFVSSQSSLMRAICRFHESHYKYLHITCHGCAKNAQIILSDNCSLKYSEFSDCFKGQVDRRRITISACQLGNFDFIKELFSGNKNLHSVIAVEPVLFGLDATSLWTGLYSRIFKLEDNTHLNIRNLKKFLSLFAKACSINMMIGYYLPNQESVQASLITKNPRYGISQLTDKKWQYDKSGILIDTFKSHA